MGFSRKSSKFSIFRIFPIFHDFSNFLYYLTFYIKKCWSLSNDLKLKLQMYSRIDWWSKIRSIVDLWSRARGRNFFQISLFRPFLGPKFSKWAKDRPGPGSEPGAPSGRHCIIFEAFLLQKWYKFLRFSEMKISKNFLKFFWKFQKFSEISEISEIGQNLGAVNNTLAPGFWPFLKNFENFSFEKFLKIFLKIGVWTVTDGPDPGVRSNLSRPVRLKAIFRGSFCWVKPFLTSESLYR